MARLATLLERDVELAELEQALSSVREGCGGIVLVEGPAGIGKSALLAAARERAEQAGMGVLSARSTEIEREYAYGAVRQLFEPPLRKARPEQRGDWLRGAAAPAAAVLSAEDAVGPPPDPGLGVLIALEALMANISEDRPYLVALDDVQWADAESLSFLSFLTPRLADLPVLFVVAARTDSREPFGALSATASDPATQPMMLAPLSLRATGSLVASRIGAPADGAFVEACHRSTGGNPFYLQALLDVLQGDKTLSAPELADRALRLAPETITRATISRAGRMSPAAIPVMRALAVLGSGVGLHHLADVAGVGHAEARIAIDELAAAMIVTPGAEPEFAHPILRNAAYADIGESARAKLHRRAADVLSARDAPPERVAAHLIALSPAGDSATVATLRAAARAATAHGAPATAVVQLRRALEEPPSEDQMSEVLFELGTAELAVDGNAAIGHFEEALSVSRTTAQRIPVARALAQARFSTGAMEPGLDALRNELAHVEGTGRALDLEVDLIAALATSVGEGFVLEAGERAERLAAGHAGETPSERAALDCLGFCRLAAGLPAEQVIAPLRRRIDRTPTNESISPFLLVMTAGTLVRCNELELAEAWAQRLGAAAKASGSIYGEAAGRWLLGGIALQRGRLHEAVASLEEAVRLASEYGAVFGMHSSVATLVDAQVDRGALTEAAQLLAVAGLDKWVEPTIPPAADVLESRARLRLAQRDVDGAEADLLAAAEIFKNRGHPGPGMTAWQLRLSSLLVHRGEVGRANELAEAGLERARRFGTPPSVARALRATARARGDADAEPLLSEAVGLLEAAPNRLEHGKALVDLGSLLRRSGQRARARELLASGLELGRASGAIPLAERAYQELRATGARPRKLLRTGRDALTPSEERVARLAERGLSNREIAQELFVARKTVEFHLGQCYRKLEISSREELKRALARDETDG